LSEHVQRNIVFTPKPTPRFFHIIFLLFALRALIYCMLLAV
jgi:hypothetical protein